MEKNNSENIYFIKNTDVSTINDRILSILKQQKEKLPKPDKHKTIPFLICAPTTDILRESRKNHPLNARIAIFSEPLSSKRGFNDFSVVLKGVSCSISCRFQEENEALIVNINTFYLDKTEIYLLMIYKALIIFKNKKVHRYVHIHIKTVLLGEKNTMRAPENQLQLFT